MRRRLAGVLLGLMMALMLMPVASASAMVGYYVSGTVVDGAGVPVEGAYVQLWDAADEFQFGETIETGPDGSFSIGPVANGDYIVELTDEIVNPYDTSWWAYTYVTVNGADVVGVEVVDAPPPSGTITVLDDLTGRPVYDAWVSSDSDDAYTDADGVCTLAATTEAVTIAMDGYEPLDIMGLDAESNIVVRLQVDIGSAYGILTGVISDGSAPIQRDLSTQESIWANAYAFDSEWNEYVNIGWFPSNSDGSFCGPVLEGDVFVDFMDYEGEYAYEFYQDVMFLSDATPVAITAGAASEIAPELGVGATISGAVTASGGWGGYDELLEQYVGAWAYSETDGYWEPVVFWPTAGPDYTLPSLPAGTYKLMLHTILADPNGNPAVVNGDPVYTDAWYKPGAALQFTEADMFDKLDLAPTVTVGAGQNLTGIDFVLARPATSVTRVQGTTRYDVAVNLARKGWDPSGDKSWDSVEHIIIACGDNGKEADPLAAAGLAGVYDCPVLLTGVTSLPESTKTAITEIAEMNPWVQIHIVGGVNSVPDARWTQIAGLVKAATGEIPAKDRIFGQSRYDVSEAIAQRMINEVGAESLGGVLIVAGDNINGFYDALAASPIAYANTMPILSVQKGVVPTSVNNLLADALADVPRYVVNSSTYVSDTVKTKVKAEPARLTTSSNRYTAASQIAVASINNKWLTPGSTAMAAKLPDALAGGVFSGKNGGVMLFTDSTSVIQPATKSFITGRKSGIVNGWVFGGANSVPAAQETSFRNLVK